jgi:hypothetical protein
VIALLLALTLARHEPAAAGGPGDLDVRVVRVRAELDVFVPTGPHTDCSVKLLAPLCSPPQVPLRATAVVEPAGAARSWRIDEVGMLVVDLADVAGEKHLTLIATVDVLVSDSVGFDDTAKKTSLYKRAAGEALREWTRPLPGGGFDDRDVSKAAAELSGKGGDVLALLRAGDELASKRVRDDALGPNDAAEALKKGAGTRLARARLLTTFALKEGVPSRLLATIPVHGAADLDLLGEFHAGEAGWLRLDLLHRKEPSFPWRETEDVVLARLDADAPIAANSRLRAFHCRGGLTAGPKVAGAPSYLCRDLWTGSFTRATSKEFLPALAAAFEEERAATRKPGEKLDVLASPRVGKSPELVDWSAPIAQRLAEIR